MFAIINTPLYSLSDKLNLLTLKSIIVLSFTIVLLNIKIINYIIVKTTKSVMFPYYFKQLAIHPRLVCDMLNNNNRCFTILVHSLYNLTLVEEQIKKLCSEDIIKTLDEAAITKMKEPIIDFLHRLKDKHPSSSQENETFDVAFRVMNFMSDNNLKPSKAQIEKYSKSKTTKTLNLFPSYEELKEKIGMEEETYNDLKQAYSSRPEFIYYFDPDLDIQTEVKKDYGCIRIGFFILG